MEATNGIIPAEDQHRDFRYLMSSEFTSLNSSDSEPPTTVTTPLDNHLNNWCLGNQAGSDQYSSQCASMCSVCYSDPSYMYSSQTGPHIARFIDSSNSDRNEYHQNLANYLPGTNQFVDSPKDFKSLDCRKIDSFMKDPLNQLQVWLQRPIIESDYNRNPILFQTSLRNPQVENDVEYNSMPVVDSNFRMNSNQETMGTSVSNYNLFHDSNYKPYPETLERKDDTQNTVVSSSMPVTNLNTMVFNGESSSKLKDSGKDFKAIKSKRSKHNGHIKKPLNAFMLFMKEMRAQVIAECTLKESAAINQILGRKWHALSREAQAKYYKLAKQEKELHQRLYPGWSARDNYATQVRRRTRTINETASYGKTKTSNANPDIFKPEDPSDHTPYCYNTNNIWSRETSYMNNLCDPNFGYLRVPQPPGGSHKPDKSSYTHCGVFSLPLNCRATTIPSHSNEPYSDRLFAVNPILETVTSFQPANTEHKSSWSHNFMSANEFPTPVHNFDRPSTLDERYSPCNRILNDINYSTQSISAEKGQNQPERNVETVCGSGDDDEESDIPTNLVSTEIILERTTDYDSNGNIQFINSAYTNNRSNDLRKDYEISKSMLCTQMTESTSTLGEVLNICPCCDSLGNKCYPTPVNPPTSYPINEMTIQSSQKMFKEHAIKNAVL